MRTIAKKLFLFFLKVIGVHRFFVAAIKEISVSDYCDHYFSTYSAPKRVIYPVTFVDEKWPLNQNDHCSWRFKNLEGRYTNEAFVLRLDDGRVVGSKGAVVTKEGLLLSDVSREFGVSKSHSSLSSINLKKPRRINGTVAVLATDGFNTYYHWMFDVLPRIHLLKKARVVDEIDYFILPSLKSEFQKQTIALLIDSDKIIEAKGHFHIEAKDLFVPSLPSLLGTVNPWTVRFLREMVSAITLPVIQYGKRIYVKRNSLGKRSLLNQEEIIQFLVRFGFQVIESENLSFLEQVSVYQNAEVIISAHGSGLANIVFCNPTTKVIELFSSDFIVPCFWVIANAASLNYYCDYDKEVSNPVYTSYWESEENDFEFPINKIDDLLKLAQIKI